MSFIRASRDERGASAVEFALTLPAFAMLIFGILEGGMLLWSQLGLQHGAEMAARCASVNPAICGAPSAIQTYAAGQSYGINPPASAFTVTTPAPACGNQVSASYAYQFFSGYWPTPTLTLGASACFPK